MAQARNSSGALQVRDQLLPAAQLLPHQRVRGRRHCLRLHWRHRNGPGLEHQSGPSRGQGAQYSNGGPLLATRICGRLCPLKLPIKCPDQQAHTNCRNEQCAEHQQLF